MANTITLTWDENPANEQVDSYRIEKSVNGGQTWAMEANTTDPTLIIGNVTEGTYQYRVSAHNLAGYSVPSIVVESPGPPSAPAPVVLTVT